eukprot:TRINITY_DN3775_c0_g1_i9.p1 TRINITY_DN3775_c0_g1~~TRINITY_DN3775_c0_g1_i9.p1  ORF type:complete len:1298 (-),score=207.53 TRINITY_DN3775_c0_g1_i9:18-3911(-)
MDRQDLSSLARQSIDLSEAPWDSSPFHRWKIYVATMMHPASKHRLFWELFLSIATVYTLVVVPLRAAAGMIPQLRHILYIDYFCDLLFWAEIVLAFYTPQSMDEVVRYDPARISRRYLRGYFIIDLISQLPYDILATYFGFDTIIYLRVPRMIRALKLYMYVEKWESQWKAIGGYFRIVLIFSVLVLVSHWIACIWWIVGTHTGDSWLDDEKIAQSPPATQYLNALYWSIVVLTTIGFGDITPQNSAEIIVAICTMFTGAFFYGLLFGNIASVLSVLDASSSRLMQKTSRLHRYMNYHKLPEDLKQRIHSYFDVIWAREKGLDEQDITQDLPTGLRSEIAVYIHRNLVNKVAFFRATEDPGFINSLVLNLKPQVALPGEVIVREGDLPTEMYFLSRGSVEVTQNGTILSVLQDGSYFGEVSLIFQERRTATVKAVEYCELLMLTKADFDDSVKYFPDFARMIKDVAKERRNTRSFHSDADLVENYVKKRRDSFTKRSMENQDQTRGRRIISVLELYRQQRRRSVAIAQNMREVGGRIGFEETDIESSQTDVAEPFTSSRARMASLGDQSILNLHKSEESGPSIQQEERKSSSLQIEGSESTIRRLSRRLSLSVLLRSGSESKPPSSGSSQEQGTFQINEDAGPGSVSIPLPEVEEENSSTEKQDSERGENILMENEKEEGIEADLSGPPPPPPLLPHVPVLTTEEDDHKQASKSFPTIEIHPVHMADQPTSLQGGNMHLVDVSFVESRAQSRAGTAMESQNAGGPSSEFAFASNSDSPKGFEDHHQDNSHNQDPAMSSADAHHTEKRMNLSSVKLPKLDVDPQNRLGPTQLQRSISPRIEIEPDLTPSIPTPLNPFKSMRSGSFAVSESNSLAPTRKYISRSPSEISQVQSVGLSSIHPDNPSQSRHYSHASINFLAAQELSKITNNFNTVKHLQLADLEPKRSRKTGAVEVQSTSLTLLAAYGANWLPLAAGLRPDALPAPRVLLHNSFARSALTSLTILSIIYNLWVIPIRIGFYRESDGNFLHFDYLTDVIFIVDIIANFYTTLIGDDGSTVVNPFLIRRHYAEGWFRWDVAASLPLDLLAIQLGTPAIGLLRLPRLIRVVRLGNYASNLEQKLQINPSLFRIFKLFVLFLTYAHTMACLLYVIPELSSSASSWKNFLAFNQFDELPLLQKYLYCFYFATTAICTVGFGDIVASSDTEKQFMIVFMLLGSVMYSTVFGSMATLVSSINADANANQQKLTHIEEYMRLRDLPEDIRQRIRNYHDIIWNRHKVFFLKIYTFKCWYSVIWRHTKVEE